MSKIEEYIQELYKLLEILTSQKCEDNGNKSHIINEGTEQEDNNYERHSRI